MHGRPRVGGPKRGAGGEVVAGLGTRDERCAHEMRCGRAMAAAEWPTFASPQPCHACAPCPRLHYRLLTLCPAAY